MSSTGIDYFNISMETIIIPTSCDQTQFIVGHYSCKFPADGWLTTKIYANTFLIR